MNTGRVRSSGLGFISSAISPEATILAGEDINDGDGDGVFGMAHMLAGNVVGRFGWKAQVPDLRSFLRDAMGNELGITVPNTGNTFGFLGDGDNASDPELPQADLEDMLFFMQMLDFGPKLPPTTESTLGEAVFLSIGCAKCHTPIMDNVELYSNLLLHNVLGLPPGMGPPPWFQGVADGQATSGLSRTPPLRGLRDTAPYFHDGRSETVDDAIRRHAEEATSAKTQYEQLSPADRAAILAFLDGL